MQKCNIPHYPPTPSFYHGSLHIYHCATERYHAFYTLRRSPFLSNFARTFKHSNTHTRHAALNNSQKKQWAQTLYLRENLTQLEIAERVGVSRVTVSKWVRDGKWEEQKAGITLTRQEQVANLYRQVAEINRTIATRHEGERFPNSKEADILGKLSAAIRNMEQETGIADVISVLTAFIEWLRPLDLDKAKELTRLADAFIKDRL